MQVNSPFIVNWSNGHGFTVYRAVDNDDVQTHMSQPHKFVVVAEYEYDATGKAVKYE